MGLTYPLEAIAEIVELSREGFADATVAKIDELMTRADPAVVIHAMALMLCEVATPEQIASLRQV